MEKPIKYLRLKKLIKESEIQDFLDEIIEKGLIIIEYSENRIIDCFEITIICAKYN
jgi:hypothetical protein